MLARDLGMARSWSTSIPRALACSSVPPTRSSPTSTLIPDLGRGRVIKGGEEESADPRMLGSNRLLPLLTPALTLSPRRRTRDTSLVILERKRLTEVRRRRLTSILGRRFGHGLGTGYLDGLLLHSNNGHFDHCGLLSETESVCPPGAGSSAPRHFTHVTRFSAPSHHAWVFAGMATAQRWQDPCIGGA